LRLRATGLPVAEIAAKTGFHEGSIRRIFHDLERRFDAEEEGTPAGAKSKGA
jgi:transcriptional regulator GlxA family with amidase domain